jgi:hypothetical protein
MLNFLSSGRHELRRLEPALEEGLVSGKFASKPSEPSFFLNIIKKTRFFTEGFGHDVFEEDCFLLMLAASCTSSHHKCFSP